MFKIKKFNTTLSVLFTIVSCKLTLGASIDDKYNDLFNYYNEPISIGEREEMIKSSTKIKLTCFNQYGSCGWVTMTVDPSSITNDRYQEDIKRPDVWRPGAAGKVLFVRGKRRKPAFIFLKNEYSLLNPSNVSLAVVFDNIDVLKKIFNSNEYKIPAQDIFAGDGTWSDVTSISVRKQ